MRPPKLRSGAKTWPLPKHFGEDGGRNLANKLDRIAVHLSLDPARFHGHFIPDHLFNHYASVLNGTGELFNAKRRGNTFS
jgi:hypothetical protein